MQMPANGCAFPERCLWLVAFAVLAAIVEGRSACAADRDVIAVAELPPPFTRMMDAVRSAMRTKDADSEWMRREIALPAQQTALEIARAAAKRCTEVGFPNDFAQGRDHPAAGPSPKYDIVKADSGELETHSKSIIICDGNLRFVRATDCIIVVTGSVWISYSTRNIVIAGHSAHITYDNLPVPPSSGIPAGQSVIVAGAVVDVGISWGTFCSAGSYANGSGAVFFVNVPKSKSFGPREIAPVESDDAPRIPAAESLDLPASMKIRRIIGQRSTDPPGIVFENGPTKVTIALGGQFPEPLQHEHKSLAGSTLVFTMDNFALFKTRYGYRSLFVIHK